MTTKQLIKQLSESRLYAECPGCGDEFKLSDALLFDGTKAFPAEALEAQDNLNEALKNRKEKLKRQNLLATDRAQITTTHTNIGKMIEKYIPTMKDFKLEGTDCRFLGDPIDLLTFNGHSKNKIESISFVEVKSGNGKLSKKQKAIKRAVEDEKVTYKVV